MKRKFYKALAFLLSVLCLMSTMTCALADGARYIEGSIKVNLKRSVTVTENYEQLFPELDGMIESIESPILKYYLAGQYPNQVIFINLIDKSDVNVGRTIAKLNNNENVASASLREAPPPPLEDRLTEADYERFYGEYHYDEMLLGEMIITLKASVKIRSDYEQLFPELEGKAYSIVQTDGVFYDLGMTLNQRVIVWLIGQRPEDVIEAINLVKDNENVVVAEPVTYIHAEAVKGDLNGDTAVTNADVIMLARTIVGLTELDDETAILADMNVSGEIDNGDLVALARQIIGA